jgi:O-antigen ligase
MFQPFSQLILSSRYESVLLFFLYLLVFNLSFSEAIKEISLGVSVLMVIPWAILKSDRSYWRRFFRMTWPLWCFLSVSLLSALNSINLFQAMRGFWGDLMSIFGLLLFWSVLSFGKNPLQIASRSILAIFSGVIAGGVVGVTLLAMKKIDFLGIMNLGDKNSTAQFLSFFMILLIVCFFERARLKLSPAVFILGFPLLILFILLCHSRAFLISLPVAAFAIFYLQGSQKVFFKGLGAVFAVIMLLLAIPIVRGEILTALAPGHDGSFISRYDAWKGAILMWKTHPLLGIGPDNFQMKNIHRIYHLPDFASHGHNFFFNLLGEYGTLGVVFMILWLFLWGFYAFSQERRHLDPVFGKVLFVGVLINLLMAGMAHPIWGGSGSLLLMLIMSLSLSSWQERGEESGKSHGLHDSGTPDIAFSKLERNPLI